MSKRLKRVFTNGNQIVHLWANQSQSDARSKNVFFQGPTIWSYGLHYKLGQLHQVKGQTIALVNSTRYSSTTAKHQSWARQGVSHMLNLQSSNVESIQTAIEETQEKLVNDLMGHFSRRSFWTGEVNEQSYLVKEIRAFNAVCDAVNQKKMKLEIDNEFISLMKDHVKISLEKKAFGNTPEELERKNQIKINKLSDSIAKWKAYGPLTQGLRGLEPQLIRVMTRINDGGRVVETTRGASVPLDEALSLLTRIVDGTAKPGDKIGSFTLTRYGNGIVTIGCHKISIDDAKAVLKAA